MLTVITSILIMMAGCYASIVIPDFVEVFVKNNFELPILTQAIVKVPFFMWTVFASVAAFMLLALTSKSSKARQERASIGALVLVGALAYIVHAALHLPFMPLAT